MAVGTITSLQTVIRGTIAQDEYCTITYILNPAIGIVWVILSGNSVNPGTTTRQYSLPDLIKPQSTENFAVPTRSSGGYLSVRGDRIEWESHSVTYDIATVCYPLR